MGWWPCKTPPCLTKATVSLHVSILPKTTPGDANNNTTVNIQDVTYLSAWMYNSGPAPPILNDADADGSCLVNVGDISYLVAWIFNGGPNPADNDCVPNSLKLTPGSFDPALALASDVALGVGAAGDGKRAVTFNSERSLHALDITLKALNGSKIDVTSRLPKDVELAWSQKGDVVRIGLLDIEGQRFITPADTSLLEITGDFEIVSVAGTQIHADGTSEMFRTDFTAGKFVSGAELPKKFALSQNHPNPFNPTTTISLSLPVASEWSITIYNIRGQKVDEFHGESEPGVVTVEWDASKYASGVYLYKAVAGEFTATRKMALVK